MILEGSSCVIPVSSGSDFTIYNIPFGIFSKKTGSISALRRPCSAIGNFIIDLLEAARLKAFYGTIMENDAERVFSCESLNEFLKLGRSKWVATRMAIQKMLRSDGILNKEGVKEKVLIPFGEVEMHLPVQVGDYTDFYSSREHAMNVGTMFRGKDNALQPNYLHLPVGYHGRASSIVVSGTPIHRPWGQVKPQDSNQPILMPSKKLDFELEMAFVVGTGNELGKPIEINNADDHIFGIVLMNDWSARDIQAWEYVPLGPFLGKSFGTIISPWIITLEALKPFQTTAPSQDPAPLPYLVDKERVTYDINLTVSIAEHESKQESIVCRSNLKYLYWNFRQQLAHHTINGCNMKSGDLCGTGTISGPTKESYGSLLELSWNGQEDVVLEKSGNKRKFIEDYDTVIMRGFCENEAARIGFGECICPVLPMSSILKS